ncbi:MAG: DUF262 domain-containing protein [Firmicutes bacterium]|nr:DUF262 domain-containing protein [Bacillota bacterium]
MANDNPVKTGLMEFLQGSIGTQFVIPVYQRKYTWTAEKEVKQFVTDFDHVLKGDYDKHFMGIIIYLQKTIDFMNREFSIIDGQQRLTTTFLMAYAVRKYFEENNMMNAVNELDRQYLLASNIGGVKYKLKPLVDDDDVYRCIVENRFDDIKDEKSNVILNYNYLYKHVNELINCGYSANDIIMAMNKLYIVVVPISEDENVQKIFESINATGTKLTSADLIRNYLLMDLVSKTQDEYYENYWRKIEDNVSTDSKELELFFRMYLSLKKYELVSKNAVYKEFTSWSEANSEGIKSLFEELVKYSKIYKTVRYKKLNSFNSKLREALEDFRKINSDLPLGLIMEFFRLNEDHKIDDDVLPELVKAINSYLLRRSFCDIDSKNISRLFPTVMKNVMNSCESENDYTKIITKLNQEMVGNNVGTSGSYMPTDKQMYDFLINANVYGRPQLRTVLDRMELSDNPAPVDLSKLSIEHLMPQTPTEEWLAELDTDEETYMANLNRLGNLTLAAVKDNSRMRNLGWKFKNEILKDTGHLKLNESIIPIERWNLNQIEERTKSLIKRICELYPYPHINVDGGSDDMEDESAAIDRCVKFINSECGEGIKKKNNAYSSADLSKGYVVVTSKIYPQGKRKKYWFGYRGKPFENIATCSEQYMIFGCRDMHTSILCIPNSFLKERLGNFNVSLDEQGNVKHHHIVIFKNPEGKWTMLLSNPELKEIDITEFVVNGY